MGTNTSQTKPTILVIDDEEVVRLLFQSLLEEEGYPMLLAETGQQGIDLLQEHRPPLAIVDKNLPDISGLELIADQKQTHPNTEFIMITGYASLDSAVKAMEMGAFSYLTKPFADMDMVMDRIRAALEVTALRFETSLLRDRLKTVARPQSLPDKPPATDASEDRPREELKHVIDFMDSFLSKRDTPPSPAIWSRMVDMMEQESHRLKRLLQKIEDE